MDYDRIDALLATSASIKLLRARNASLIISFLHKEFKARNLFSIPHHELAQRLADYLDAFEKVDERENGEMFLDDVQARARKYLDTWSDQGFLRKYDDEAGERLNELTPATEKVLHWIAELDKREFVGTESRMKDIFTKLRDLLENSTEDPEKKIKELKKKKREIERQIAAIARRELVPIYTDTQIKERFYELSKLARELLADFKEVEQNFRDITRSIYEKRAQQSFTKGRIVSDTLDALDELKEKDQGKSFYEFWKLLIEDSRDEELQNLIRKIYQLLEERRLAGADPFLRKLKNYLHEAASKVNQSNHLLAEKLNRTITEQDLLARQQATMLINEIRNLGLRVIEHPPATEAFVEIAGRPEIDMSLSRPLGEPPAETNFARRALMSAAGDLAEVDWEMLFDQFAINLDELNRNIRALLRTHRQVTLREVLQHYPVTKGLAEIISYLYLASRSDKHFINDQVTETVVIGSPLSKAIQIPQVIFCA